MPLPDDSQLDAARQQADPLADDTLARLLGPWPAAGLGDDGLRLRLAAANRAIASWRTNADVANWQPDPGVPAEISGPLADYLRQAQALPDWVDPAQLQRAEDLFFEEGVLSCLLLFCASLPECYVVPDLAEVLQATAQLEARTEHRIRATAAMIFPIMMKGGLTHAEGAGRAQVMKVRLIHATVRHLLLRGNPAEAPAQVAALAAHGSGMHAELAARGWNPERDGLPCNQEELGYTLLTFGYVLLRSLRRLGVGHAPNDELALLHTWNAMGALVGVQPALMPQTMQEAEALFARLQQRGFQQRLQPDPRPPLSTALMNCMAAVIPLPLFKRMPVLLSRYLIGRRNAAAIGLSLKVVPWTSRIVFWLLLGAARCIDTLVQLLLPRFSLSRLLGRLIGYRLLTRLLMDRTRPLQLPEATRAQMAQTVAAWGRDPHAPAWINALEDRFTVAGDWHA